MSFDLILQNVAKHIQLNDAEKERFTSMLQARTLKRRHFLLQEGDVCRYSAFVVSGCLRGFSVDKNGYEHVLNFATPDWWMADLYSLITQKPGVLNIEALEPCSLLLLSKNDQEILYQEIPKFERFFRIIVENSLASNQQRLLDNLSLSAEDRYRNFCARYPSLVDCIPQKHIASYLGITPEFFSKMRSTLLKKQS